jgi:hypothetical protein
MIGSLPFRVLFAVWWLQRVHQTGLKPFNYTQRIDFLENLRRSLPIVQLDDVFGTWLLTQILLWIDQEKLTLINLETLNVQITGTLKK